MLYMPVYLITIPSMYILLVIYSLFNLWNTGWGTREKPEEKKSEDQAKEEAAMLKEIEEEEAKKKKAGVFGTIMGAVKFGDDKNKDKAKNRRAEEKGSVDFSCGNLMRCLCFTHEDPHDPNKQLERIGDHLKEVSQRLSRIEHAGVVGRRLSTTGSKSRRTSSIPEENGQEEEEVITVNEPEVENQTDANPEEEKIIRDEEANPWWFDNERLKGKPDYLNDKERTFFKDLINEYLTPFENKMSKKDFMAEKAKTKRELYEYRDSFIFTFLMINSFYIVLITMLQVQTPLKIPWTILSSFNLNGLDGLEYTFEYDKPENQESPLVTIHRETAMLDMLGLVFLLTFSSITFAQVIGMCLHRWQTCKF